MTEQEFADKYRDEKRIEVIMCEYYNEFKKRMTADKYIELFSEDNYDTGRRRLL